MQIDLPQPEQQQLIALAAQQGFSSLEDYVREVLLNTARSSAVPDLSAEQLAASVNMMREGDAEIDAGGGRDLEEAMLELADKYKLDVEE